MKTSKSLTVSGARGVGTGWGGGVGTWGWRGGGGSLGNYRVFGVGWGGVGGGCCETVRANQLPPCVTMAGNWLIIGTVWNLSR